MSTIWAGESLESPFAPPEEHERVGPVDGRRQVPEGELLAAPYRWICSLDVTFERPYPKAYERQLARASGLTRSTGLLIGPRHVLTSAHSLYLDGHGRPSSVYVAPGRSGRDDPFGRIKAVARLVPGRALEGPGLVREHDYGMVILDRDIAGTRHDALGGRPFGHWGSSTLGEGTVLRALDRAFLTGKPVNTSGYPGDRCGSDPLDLDDPRAACDTRDQATTQWRHSGAVSWDTSTRLFCHTADTARGQSGSPVWIFFRDGRRFLVGVHVDAGCFVRDAQRRPISRLNRAVHINAEVLAMLRTWMQ